MSFHVEGWASTPDLDHARDVVVPSAFDNSIRTKGLKGPKGIKLLWQHASDKPLGAITKLEKRNKGLWIEASIDEDISYGKDAAAAIRSIGGLSFSIGYRIVDADIGVDAQGYEYLLLIEVDLSEISVVTFPCNDEAVMTFAGKKDWQKELANTIAKMKSSVGGHNDTNTSPATSLTKINDQLTQFRNVLKG